jgi:GTP:adenosylcobinamide-phosphate guanylyltransferase
MKVEAEKKMLLYCCGRHYAMHTVRTVAWGGGTQEILVLTSKSHEKLEEKFLSEYISL